VESKVFLLEKYRTLSDENLKKFGFSMRKNTSGSNSKSKQVLFASLSVSIALNYEKATHQIFRSIFSLLPVK